MIRVNARRNIRPKRIERSREIYKAIAAGRCGLPPKQFAERFMEQGVRELRKLSWISRRAARYCKSVKTRSRSARKCGILRFNRLTKTTSQLLPYEQDATPCLANACLARLCSKSGSRSNSDAGADNDSCPRP